ncbi:cytochrome C oxidase subunit IV family protein [Luteolibacter flavescens]|uniref:Cytochrome C oxidase subunit IV family protein n=1 Tax=Luteolibacter flavescens TaxID=1859460 RepID=A0ABT3FPB1_9BACT|nr:cytochrome C oxidase subunit IV family protein [Luteolibacter flavescens]MCW1885417.1 cytochrome C oxidase subunit IV family protein [Luteolibacter flavescens]
MADSPEAIQKSLRLYKLIGAALFVGTVVTVAVATVPALDFGKHGFDTADMVLGLAIASVKASLVAAIFMHLNHEKSLIYWVFGFGIIGAVILLLLTGLAESDPLHYNGFKDGVPGSDVKIQHH